MKRLQKYVKQIKNRIKSEKLSNNHSKLQRFDSFYSDSQESSVSRVREKFKMNLSAQIHIETRKRRLLNSSMQKLMRKEKIEEKRKQDLHKKREIESRKKDEIQRRINDLLHSQRQKAKVLNEKFSRVSSRLSNLTPKNASSKLTRSLSRNLDESFSEDNLKYIHEKLDRSSGLYKETIKNITDRLADHNEKVHKTLQSQISYNELRTHNKLLDVMKKNQELEKYRNKKQKIFHDAKMKKIAKKTQIHSKVQINIEDEFDKMRKRVNKLESKSLNERKVLMNHLAEMSKDKEFKTLKKILKDEDTRQNLKRIKKEKDKKRNELLEKYLEDHRRFLMMKENKEKCNQKIRVEASLAKQEHIKAKMIHLMINRSDDPHDISKVIEKKFT